MYKIVYDVEYIDHCGRRGHVPDYFLGFKTSDPSGDRMVEKLLMGRMSIESKCPGIKILSIKVVSEGYL